jgi:hypothetical protein
MPVPANLVHEESVTTGTGDLTVTAVNGKQRFATAFTTAGTNVFDYFISNRDAAEWERGTGSAPTTATLRRDQCLETNAGSTVRISFSAGTKDVVNDVPALTQVRTVSTVASTGLFCVFDSTLGNLIKVAGTAPITSLTSGDGITVSGTTISAEAATTNNAGIMEVAEDTEYQANTAGSIALTPAKVWSAAAITSLSAAGTVVSVDMGSFLSLANRAMAAAETLGNPTNTKVGQHFVVSVQSTTNRTLTLGTAYKLWAGVETGPYAITTAEKVFVTGYVETSTGIRVTAFGRTTALT